MRNPKLSREEQIRRDLSLLYQRIDANAECFGMSPTEVERVKKDCAIAYRHKLLLDSIRNRRGE